MGSIDIPKNLCTQNTICHYSKANICIEKILFYSSIRLSNIERTNDPFEYITPSLIIESYGYTSDPVEELYFEKPSTAVHNIAFDYLQNIKFLSFCMNESMSALNFEIDKLCFMRPRMWSQYGENHSGVCLLFNREAILKEISGKKFFTYGNIEYKKYHEIKAYKTIIDASMCKKDGIEKSSELVINHINKYYLMKHNDYRDESEFRILHSNGSNDVFIDIKNCLSGIVISDRISEYNINALLEYSRKYSIKLFQINWKNRDISITEVKIDV
jgi:hypothetical protein